MTNDQLRSHLRMIKANVARDIDYQNKQDKSDSRGNVGNFGKTQETSASTPGQNAKGWKLHVDSAGNKAYVSPDGKQYEEVK